MKEYENLNVDTWSTEDSPKVVVKKRCKFNGQRLEVGDTVPEDWPKKTVDNLKRRNII